MHFFAFCVVFIACNLSDKIVVAFCDVAVCCLLSHLSFPSKKSCWIYVMTSLDFTTNWGYFIYLVSSLFFIFILRESIFSLLCIFFLFADILFMFLALVPFLQFFFNLIRICHVSHLTLGAGTKATWLFWDRLAEFLSDMWRLSVW